MPVMMMLIHGFFKRLFQIGAFTMIIKIFDNIAKESFIKTFFLDGFQWSSREQ